MSLGYISTACETLENSTASSDRRAGPDTAAGEKTVPENGDTHVALGCISAACQIWETLLFQQIGVLDVVQQPANRQ